MNWIPLLKLTEEGAVFGLSEGQWSAQTRSGEIVSISTHPNAFLPFLEIDFVQAEQKIKDSIANEYLVGQETPSSPLLEAIKCGLHAPSEYWQLLALKRALQCNERALFRDDIRSLEKSGATQGVRHQAQKVIREISED